MVKLSAPQETNNGPLIHIYTSISDVYNLFKMVLDNKLRNHEDCTNIQSLIAWLPMIEKIEVGYNCDFHFSDIIFMPVVTDRVWHIREGEKIRLYNTGIEYIVNDIINGNRQIKDITEEDII